MQEKKVTFNISGFRKVEALVQRYSVKKVLLEISQNSQEKTQPQACNFIKTEIFPEAECYSEFRFRSITC